MFKHESMAKYPFKLKLAFISGLKDIVLAEVAQKIHLQPLKQHDDWLQFTFTADLSLVRSLKSVLRAYVVVEDQKYNPSYISRHKSILGRMIEMVLAGQAREFASFKLICAGSGSPAVRAIATYVADTFGLVEAEADADLKLHITKTGELWEAGVQITPRPLSVRDYKVKNMPGAMDPTVAYALNYLCQLEGVRSYLNAFSGSATLLIEAGQCYPRLDKLVGFDHDKIHLSLAIANIKRAGLIRRIELKEADIFDRPELGQFDAIVADLPFGMLIGKYDDLEKMYQSFIEYCQEFLTPSGVVGVYTHNHEMLKEIIQQSRLHLEQEVSLKLMSSANNYLYPKIFICRL